MGIFKRETEYERLLRIGKDEAVKGAGYAAGGILVTVMSGLITNVVTSLFTNDSNKGGNKNGNNH